MADAGVLDAPAGLGVSEKVVRVPQGLAQQHAVGAGPSGADQERRYVLQREGATHDGLELVADIGVLVVAGLAAAGLLGQNLLVDGLQLLGRVLVAAGYAGVLAALPGGAALMPRAPADDAGHQLVALVGVDGLHELDHQRLGIAALPFLHVEDPFNAVDGVAGADVPEILPVVSGEETMDAGQSPAGATRPMAHVGSAGMADDGAVLGVGGIFLVAEHGIGIADSVYEVQERAQGGIANEILGAHTGADHCPGTGDGLGRDAAFDLRQGLDHALAFVLAGHCSISGMIVGIRILRIQGFSGYGGQSRLKLDWLCRLQSFPRKRESRVFWQFTTFRLQSWIGSRFGGNNGLGSPSDQFYRSLRATFTRLPALPPGGTPLHRPGPGGRRRPRGCVRPAAGRGAVCEAAFGTSATSG